ncbi:CubicO group peptidase (beta-lactamase class C family) [Rheinheimera pacifica]|uniref:serine hydrolase domain-containing protein n=1 Tax=Rheinheimera pacifica TaxID=173990 RepID=UPI002858DF3C|nr:serine hydrolase domain-containing protein [Rheinheimera pacifica]MDR6981967.1 CubicO group peptidase (beta-lactamase class C family) [Rheinheimera pacifica]
MKKLCGFVIVLFSAIAALWFLLPKQQNVSQGIAELELYLPALMEEAAVPGLAIARIKNGQTVLLQTYGKANIATGTPVTKDTLFNLASISKPIMGLVLLQLADQGKLDLEQDINNYLPFRVDNPHTAGEKITLRHLASHSSGIADFYDINSYAENQEPDISLGQHLTSLLLADGDNYHQGEHFLPQLPGEKRQYSNLAAGLAGYLVEATTGMSLAQYSKVNLFPALAMHHSSWLLHDVALETVAVPYEVEQCVPYFFLCADTESPSLNSLISRYINPPAKYKSFKPYPHFGNPQYPDGGVRSSISELSQFLVAILNNQDSAGRPLLSDAMYNEMFSLQLPESVSANQRFFWRDNEMGLTGHMGSDLGVFTALYFDRSSKDGFIILMNRGVDDKAAAAMKQIATKLVEL